MTDGNYIKIYRSLLEWEWYSDINTCRLFLHMLLNANWKDGNFQGTTVPRGSFISSLPKLSEETKLTIREVRTAISHLKMTGELTVKSHAKYSVFTVINYNLYQTNDTQIDSLATGKRQPNDIQTTTIEERKKERKEEGKKIYGEYRHVKLTEKQVGKLVQDYGQDIFDKAVKRLDEYIQETGKTYKDHNLTIRRWVIASVTKEDSKKDSPKPGNKFTAFPQREYSKQDYAAMEKALLQR